MIPLPSKSSVAAAALLAGNAAVCSGFTAPSLPMQTARLSASAARHTSSQPLRMVATPPLQPPGKSIDDPSVWEGTKNVNRELLVRIDDEWYDLSRWRAAHPAGTHWIDMFKDRDATEVMYGFHSTKGMEMMKRLPKAKHAPEGVAPVTQSTRNFRKWRQELVDAGWFEREWDKELFNVGSWAAAFTLGVCLSQFTGSIAMQFAAVTVLGIANTIAGWLSHDYTHGRGKFCEIMRPFGSFCGGMSPTWWSDKHNTHHALTNEVGIDEDIATDPALYLWAPDPKNDSPARKWQGVFWPIPMSFLFVLWRFDSLQVAIKRKLWPEVFGCLCHYAFVLSFVPPLTFLGALFVSGFMTAVITTVTHQGEELFFDKSPDFVDAQYMSTRDAACTNPFSEWLWGGMQYQLEHHLFPTMPRYKYPALMEAVENFGKENGLEYRITDEWTLLKMNIDIYKEVATLDAVPGAKASRPDTGKEDLGSILQKKIV